MTSHVFISHSSRDSAAAERIVTDLETRGVTCWLAQRDIPAGDRWASEIAHAIETCDRLVLLLSRSADESEEVERELSLAGYHRKPIHPIALDGHRPSRATRYFTANRQIEPYERALERISREMDAGSHPAVGTQAGVRTSQSVLRRAVPGGLIAAAVMAAIGTAWLLRPQVDRTVAAPSGQSVPASVGAVPPMPDTRESDRPVKSAGSPAQAAPIVPAVVEARPESSTAPAPAPRMSVPAGALQPRVSLDGYAPPPAPRDDHGVVRGDAHGPLRPKINLGD